MGDERPEQRREHLVQVLRERGDAVRGSELAQSLGVSRQVIVQDIAVLRASGTAIVPSPRGYRWLADEAAGEPGAFMRTRVAVRHTPRDTATELYALVDAGVRVVDVVVEHPLYGELRGLLDLGTRADVEGWLGALAEHNASMLSALTGGVHLHTLEAADPLCLARARSRLIALGFLLM